jgi:flagella basal body P-ring formation protein FlgA
MKLFFILFLLTCNIFSAPLVLKKEYHFFDENIKGSDIFKSIKSDFTLLKIPHKKTKYRIKAKELVKTFKKHSYEVSSKASVITFIRDYDFDMSSLHVRLKEYYKKYYKKIDIKALHVRPKSYMQKLPRSYEVVIPAKNYHNNHGTFYLKTDTKRRLFFDYKLDAFINVVVAKRTIERKENLTPFNTKIKNIKFKNFKSPPLSKISSASKWCAKIRLKEGRILTQRDIKTIPLVKKNQNVTVIVRDGSLHVELSAIAQKDGALYDMITIQKSNGEHLKAQVIGANRVEIR